MRAWQLAAGAVAMMTAHGAMAEVAISAGSDGGAGAGAFSAAAVRPGSQFDDFRLAPLTVTVTTTVQDLAGLPHFRRPGATPDNASAAGFHISAGFQTLMQRMRGFDPMRAAKITSLIYAPAMIGALPVGDDMRRKAPALGVSWSHALAAHALFSLEAGSRFEHGGSHGLGLADRTMAVAWSRVEPVARASFGMRF